MEAVEQEKNWLVDKWKEEPEDPVGDQGGASWAQMLRVVGLLWLELFEGKSQLLGEKGHSAF